MALHQNGPLLGKDGLLPANKFLNDVRGRTAKPDLDLFQVDFFQIPYIQLAFVSKGSIAMACIFSLEIILISSKPLQFRAVYFWEFFLLCLTEVIFSVYKG